MEAQRYLHAIRRASADGEEMRWIPGDLGPTVLNPLEILEMHATGNYHADTSVQREVDDDEDEDSDDGSFDEDIRNNRPPNDDGEESDDDEVPVFQYDRNRYGRPEIALVDALEEVAGHVPQEQATAAGYATYWLLREHGENNPTPWQQDLAERAADHMACEQDAYEVRMERLRAFWENSDEAWSKVEPLIKSLEALQQRESTLRFDFAEAITDWEREDKTMSSLFLTHSENAVKIAKTKVGLFDILSWFPHQTPLVKTALTDIAEHYRHETALKNQIKWSTIGTQSGVRVYSKERAEERFYGYEDSDQSFGYEYRWGDDGYANFNIRIDEDITVDEYLKLVRMHCEIRHVRFLQALDRLAGHQGFSERTTESGKRLLGCYKRFVISKGV
ncbi:hypothetical protein LTR37_001624 [Vermiconidia calcicola]|uniref:Uncharacterized protein n=1 Tax=Vermiconidia calcicola TaxID=1690605 RepID=A0ACC3NVR0_9PEZI|nr:hypothetical protein LTR37_001624 [Vermiconidia calcicola]